MGEKESFDYVQKATAWENAIRNRLSIYCPKKFASKVVNEMTLVMDIYPQLFLGQEEFDLLISRIRWYKFGAIN